MEISSKKVKKYIGACCENDFVVVDCRGFQFDQKQKESFSIENINKYGVDSALFIVDTDEYSSSIQVFEKDGSESDSCGNGILLVSYFLDIKEGTIGMKNEVVLINSTSQTQSVRMDLRDARVEGVGYDENSLFTRAGEPHVIYLVSDVMKFDLEQIGQNQQSNYSENVNVDLIQKVSEFEYLIRTYERGVFEETKSCGTGSLSSYLAISYIHNRMYKVPIKFVSTGGIHWVSREGRHLKLETLKTFCKMRNLE